jgi:hypothetical protein
MLLKLTKLCGIIGAGQVLHHVMPTRYTPDRHVETQVRALVLEAQGTIRAYLKTVMTGRGMDVSPQNVWKFAY